MANATPTPYADLNTVLHELVSTARAVLGENFCGAYLQGSFALGDADAHSDVDFLIVTHDEVSDAQAAALRPIHAWFPTLDIEWARHLEGSYVPKVALRRRDLPRRTYLYVDNGSPILEWSDHDNSAVVRWVLREYGVRLAGPEPATLVDEVTADELRGEMLDVLREWAEWLRTDAQARDGAWSAWLQPHVVLAHCRALYTLRVGRVASKLAAGRWALNALDGQWAPLIQRALDDRPDPWLRVHRPADHEAVAATQRFSDYALRLADAAQGP